MTTSSDPPAPPDQPTTHARLPGLVDRASLHTLTIAVLLTAGAFVWVTARSVWTYRTAKGDVTRATRLREISGTILRLDEVLTMSALMAATTGDQRWRARYRNAEPELDAAFAELRALLPEDSDAHQGLATADSANVWLVEREVRALALAAGGDLAEATAVLQDAAYEGQKARYLAGMRAVDRTLAASAAETQAAHENDASISVAIGAIVLVMLGTGWLLVLRLVHAREEQLVTTNRALADRTRELSDLNLQLDQRVAERTRKLELAGSELRRLSRDAGVSAKQIVESNERLLVEIAERRQAEEEAQESEARYRSLFDNAIYGIYQSTPGGRIILANQAMAEILGYRSPKELQGASLAEDVYVDPGERARLMAEFGNAEDIPPVEVEWRRKTGDVCTVRLTGRTIREPDGSVRAYEMIAEDVTERKKLGEHVRQVQKMESLGRLAGGIAHDFNNLLTVILAEAALAQQAEDLNDRALKAFGQVQAAAERAAVLTRQLLTFSRRQAVEPLVLSLNDIIGGMETMFSRLLGENAHLALHLATDVGPVRIDRGQMEQVILNLVLNARDAISGSGTITVETRSVHFDEEHALVQGGVSPGLHSLLSVSDSGTGMTEETKQRLFEPFYTTKEAGRGTGLGLATTYAIVQQSDGHITVYSELGVGTTIKVYLPTVTDAIAEAPREAGVIPLGRGETVLIVEDEPSVMSVTSRILTRLGYSVATAEDGESALALLETWPKVDLLLTDVILPGMRGREVAERATAMRPGLRVLYASGYTDDVILEQQLLESDTVLLNKPFTIDNLAVKVREVLDAEAAA